MNAILQKTSDHIKKALVHLEKSALKTEKLDTHLDALTDSQLESWESHASRFARVVDLFSSKYLRLRILTEEPGFRGSTRDWLNKAEKIGLIDSAQKWFELKELRNKQAHDYEDDDLSQLYELIRIETKALLDLKKQFP